MKKASLYLHSVGKVVFFVIIEHCLVTLLGNGIIEKAWRQLRCHSSSLAAHVMIMRKLIF